MGSQIPNQIGNQNANRSERVRHHSDLGARGIHVKKVKLSAPLPYVLCKEFKNLGCKMSVSLKTFIPSFILRIEIIKFLTC